MEMIDIILIGVSGYVLVYFALYKFQERFLFKPEKLSKDFKYNYQFPFEEMFFDVDEEDSNIKINGLRFFAPAPAKGLVLYFHGNSRSIKGWGKFSTDFTKHGFDVVMLDYRGFGKSTGKRSERDMKSDFQDIYLRLTTLYPENRIVVYGRSLGSGFAAKIASVNEPLMLILESPYYSMSRLVQRTLPILPVQYLLRYKLRTNTYLRYVKCPIRIIHGTKDLLISHKASHDLMQIQPEHTALHLITGGGHNNLQHFPQYHETLEEIMKEAEEFFVKKPQSPELSSFFNKHPSKY
jgi:uncharacterized protein